MTKAKKSRIEAVHIEEAARLKAIYESRAKMSQAAFGAEYDIGSQGMVWQYLNAGSALNLEAALKFAGALKCAVSDFSPRLAEALLPQSQSQSQVPNVAPPVTAADGLDHSAYTGNPVAGGESRLPADREAYPAGAGRAVWVIGNGNGGLPDRVWDDQGYPVGASDEFANIATEDEHAFIVRVRGDSMVPKYSPGEFALVEPGTMPDVGDDVLVRLGTGGTMIKTLQQRTAAGVRLSSYNSKDVLFYETAEITWMYWVPHPVPAKKIKTRG